LNSFADVAQFSYVVEKIYDAAIDADRWMEALDHIGILVGATGSGLHFGYVGAQQHVAGKLYVQGFPETFNAKLAEFAPIWAVQTGMFSWQVGDVHHLPDMFPTEEFQSSRFYKELIQPEGQLDYIGMIALKEGSHYVPLTLGTSVEAGPFSERSVELVRLLAPHICRAAKIGLALELKTLDATLLEATLNGLSASVFLIDERGRLAFMNHEAKRLMKRGRGFKIIDNRLIPLDPDAAAEFESCFGAALENSNVFSTETLSIALPDELGGLVATLLPLGNGKRKFLTAGATSSGFAVFVQDPMTAPLNPGEGFAKLYGLTPAELRILMAIAVGNGPQEAAKILGISLSTVKSHLQHIFNKTGTNRQADLMQLLMRNAAPLTVQN
jgi:DNA-binding CsgD family transcriptional regulator/PAS domain-containing protein